MVLTSSWPATQSINVLQTKSAIKVLHAWYGHLNYTSLSHLFQKERIHGLPRLEISEKKCERCLKGHQHRKTLSEKNHWPRSQIPTPQRYPPHHRRPSSKLNDFYTMIAEQERDSFTYMEVPQDLDWQTTIQSEIESLTNLFLFLFIK